MKPIFSRMSLPAAVLAVTLGVAACGEPDPGTLVTSAKDYLAKNDIRAAIIQLRNARQHAPDDAEIRYLLGKAYLDVGDVETAENELRRAAELRYPAEQVQPLIAQTLLARRDFRALEKAFADPGISDPRARADIHATLGMAALMQGDMAQARKQIERALALDPKLSRAHFAHARLLLRGGDVAGASTALDAALAADPTSDEAAVVKSHLLIAQGRFDEAIGLLEKAADANPYALHVRHALVSAFVFTRQVEKAEPVVAAMRKIAPKDALTVYGSALVELAKGNAAKAREYTQVLMNDRFAAHPGTLFVAALADYELKNYAQAEDSLQKLLARSPNDLSATRVLAATYLRTGRAQQAIDTAEASLRRVPTDPTMLRIAAEARLMTGNVAEATKLLERATQLDRDPNLASQVKLAQMRLASGDTSRGFAELQKLSSEEPTKIQADLALYLEHLKRRQYAKALAAIDAIDKKQPNSALASELRGNVYAAQRNVAEARKHYARALELAPNRLTSARMLGFYDLQEGKVADARARYERMAKADPRNEMPLIAMAEVLALSGAPASEVKAALDRAIAADPNSVSSRMALVAHYRRLNDMRGAVDAARAAANALPNEPRIIELLGATQLAAGEYAPARETFSRLTQLVPQSPAPWLRVSEAYLALKDYNAAIDAQRRALSIQSDYGPALVGLATTQLVAGRPDAAIAEARKLQRENPKQAFGYALEAELLAAQKKYAEALGPMREALSRQQTTSLASRNYALLTLAGRTAEANAFADRWTKEHAKDGAFLAMVGQLRHEAGNANGAIAAYRAALDIDPDNALVLNNLAWLLNEKRQPEARELAERAYALAPMNANIVDTLGAVALAQGDTARAISLMRQATNLSPRDPRLRMNLARALAKSGDKAGAKRVLEQVVAADTRASVKAEAQQLLREL